MLELGFETLFSASHFSDSSWKWTALAVAEEIAQLLKDPALLLRLKARRSALSRLFHSKHQLGAITMATTVDQRTNAWLGEIPLFLAQTLLDKSAPTDNVQAEINRFQPVRPASPSFQEKIVLLKGRFLVARSLRFNGEFQKALGLLYELLHSTTRLRIAQKIVPHYAETLCEVGLSEQALHLLKHNESSQPHYGNQKRWALALANCHLMAVLWGWINDHRQLDPRAVMDTVSMFQELKSVLPEKPTGLLSQQHKFLVYCGLAMAYRIGNSLHEAYRAWKDAVDYGNSIWPETGYAAIITTYSQSEVALCLKMEGGQELRAEAQALWEAVGRRHFIFLGLGSVWPDILFKLEAQAGRQGIIPVRVPLAAADTWCASPCERPEELQGATVLAVQLC